jgi:molybdopterin-guanine dinucleotide biosynthesis protein A
MGLNKGWLRRDGRSLATRLLLEMAAVGLEPLCLNAPEAPPDLPAEVHLLPDERPGQGPLGGLVTVLRRLRRPVLVAAVDMPGLERAHLEALLASWRPGELGRVARRAGAWHPTLGLYTPELLPALDAALASGSRALQPLVEELALAAWEAPAAAVVNLNRPEERRAWEEEHGPLQDP